MPTGRPDKSIRPMPDPKELYLSLKSRRFEFSDVRVKDGQKVAEGDILAKDPDNYAVPLLAPRGGTVVCPEDADKMVLKDLAPRADTTQAEQEEPPHIARQMGAAGIKRFQLLTRGAWRLFYDAYTGRLPDPLGSPQAVIVSTMTLEPFLARGDVQLRGKLLNFTRGLEHLQSLLEYQPMYMVMPDIESDFAREVEDQIRGYAWVKKVEVPLKYPYDNLNILARHLGLKKEAGEIWGLGVEGVIAVDRALTADKPCLSRIISVGGPPVKEPTHLEVLSGYPIRDIVKRFAKGDIRVLDGGMLTGSPIEVAKDAGLDVESRGVTILEEVHDREFLGFMRPGGDRKSYSNAFLSVLRGKFREPLNTQVRGEVRPCIACNFCAEMCPAGILPYLIHKYLYADQIEEAEQARIDLCVRCGLCSFVCPSKLELMTEFADAQDLIEREKAEALAEAKAKAEAEAKAKAEAEAAQAEAETQPEAESGAEARADEEKSE